MDFTTTEAADDLGGLVRTITDSVCTPEHQRELDGLDAAVRPRPVGQADRRRHPVHRRAGVVGRRRFRGARAGRGAGRAGPPAGRGALPGVGGARPPARWRSSAPRRCSRSGACPRSTARRSSTVALDGEMGEGPVQAHGDRRRLPADRHPHPGRLRPGGRRVPGARRNRFGHHGFPGRRRRPGRDGDRRWTPPGTGSVGHLELRRRRVGRRPAWSAATRSSRWLTHAWPPWAAAHFSSACSSAALELTAEYAREREQFDRPIGSFQAVSSAAGRRLHRRQGAAADADPGGVAAVRGPARRHRRRHARRSGRPMPATASRTPPCTCTAASASTPTTRCTGTSWPPSRPSSRSAAPPGSCCASAANWPTHPLEPRDWDATADPTVTDLLAPLVDVDDRGVLLRGLVQSAGATTSSTAPRSPRRCARGWTPTGRRMSACCWRTRRSSRRCWSPPALTGIVPVGLNPIRRGAALAARHPPRGLPTGAGRFDVGCDAGRYRPHRRRLRRSGQPRSPRTADAPVTFADGRARRPVHADLHVGHQR